MGDGGVVEWRVLGRALSRADFCARFAHLFLLRRRLSRTSGPIEPIEGDWTERVQFDTKVVEPDPHATPPKGRLAGARIVALTKSPHNPFRDRISLGRAQNCDIVVRDASVSKLHAHFRPVGPRDVDLIDLGSANGTRVNGDLVLPNHPRRVTSGDTVIFGGVAVQLLDAGALHDLL